MAFADLIKETMDEDIIEQIMPILDKYQLCCLKQMQMKAKKMPIPKELEDMKIHCESEIIFLIEGCKINKN